MCVTERDQSISTGSQDPARVSPVPLHCKEMIPLIFFLRGIKVLLCGVFVLFSFFPPSLLFPAFSQRTGAGGGVSPNHPLALMCAPVDDILCQAPLSAPRLAQGICSPCLLLPGGRKRHHPCFKSRSRQVRAQPFSSIPVMSV